MVPTTNNKHALSNKLPTYLQSLVCVGSARPSTALTGPGSDAASNLSITLNTWKPPDISSLHNVFRTGISPCERCKLLFLQKDIPALHTKTALAIGGAERDRTADPLLAKQVLSQLSYSPNHHKHLTRKRQDQVNHQANREWWARVDSNYRPHAYQACALTN